MTVATVSTISTFLTEMKASYSHIVTEDMKPVEFAAAAGSNCLADVGDASLKKLTLVTDAGESYIQLVADDINIVTPIIKCPMIRPATTTCSLIMMVLTTALIRNHLAPALS